MQRWRWMSAMLAAGVLLSASSASALCIYKGVDHAETTVAEEFADATWVVRARVVSGAHHWSETDDDEPWTVYRLEVLERFKGHAPSRLRFFTFRNSGAFYLERPWRGGRDGTDVGSEYLLFLEPWNGGPGDPAEMKGAVFVTYSCGVSGPWRDVGPKDRAALRALRHRP